MDPEDRLRTLIGNRVKGNKMLGRWLEILDDLRLRISNRIPRRPLTPASSKRSVPPPRRDVLFQNAALLSVAIHLTALLVLPPPGASGESTIPERVSLSTKLVPPPATAPPSPQPELQPVEVEPPEPSAPETKPAEEAPIEPSPAPQEDDLRTSRPEFSVDPPAAVSGPLDAPPQAKGRERERVDSLLQKTLQQASSHHDRDRWLMLEVREKVRVNLSRLQQRNLLISDGPGEASCLLGFLIDAEGWIFDITLRPAPGLEIDAFAIRDAIAVLNPVKAPPAGVATPIHLQLRIDFLE